MQGYRERLTPTPWLFVATALVIPAALVVFLPINGTVGVIVAIALYLAIAAVLVATTPTVAVSEGGLVAGRATLPWSAIGAASGFRGTDAVRERGVGLDARAWLLLRGWIGPVVRVEVTDADDPTPYWLVSTRHPERLVAALTRPPV